MPGKLNFFNQNFHADSLPHTKENIFFKDLKKILESDNIKMNESELKNSWFKTWPEKNYDKLDQTSDSFPDHEKSSPDHSKNSKSQIPLNKLLDKIPLAYSPITKQLHIITPRKHQKILISKKYQSVSDGDVIGNSDGDVLENSDEEIEQFWTPAPGINENGKKLVLQSCLKEADGDGEEKLCKLWNSKIGYSEDGFGKGNASKNDQCTIKTETSSYSSIVSSLSDNSHLDESTSSKFSMLDNDDLSVRSLCSHDSESTYEENSKFFNEKTQSLMEKAKYNKKRGLSGFFTRNVFTWKPVNSLGSHGWRFFGKTPDQEDVSSNSGQPEVEIQSSGTGSPLSVKKYEDFVVSSSALILHNRPDNLPAKSIDEQQKHKLEYEQIVQAAKKKEIKESKKRKKQLQQQLKFEEQLTNASKIWSTEILPKWETMKNSKKTRDLWWAGIPPSIRGKVWKLAIGNELNITYQLYEICAARAQEKLKSKKVNSQDDQNGNGNKESSVELIQLDISRTFPQLCIFQEGGPYYDILHCLLGAYVCYRPDVGYVQGMSFIAAILILNLEPADAFICFANLLNRPCHMAFFSLNQSLMHTYYETYNNFFKENLPKLYQHFEESSLTPDLYLLDWVYSVFAKAMPLDIACRVWDVFLRDGEEFLFRTALGILHLNQSKLLKLDFINGAQFLTKLPEDLSPDLLFKSIECIKMSVGKVRFSQILSDLIEKYSSR